MSLALRARAGLGGPEQPIDVYGVCMSRVNIYLPDDLASRAREAGLNVSALAREAIERELRVQALRSWLDEVRANPVRVSISQEEMERIWDEVDEEWGRAAHRWIDPERYEHDLTEREERG